VTRMRPKSHAGEMNCLNSTGRGEGIRGGARVHTIPDAAMGVLRVLST